MADIATFWDELTAAALVGTARAPLPDGAGVAAPGLAALLARIDAGTPERRLLVAAGAAALWRQAGTLPVAAAMSPPEPAPAETAAVCPPATELHLKRILGGEYPTLLQEWLALAAQRQFCIPPRVLPEVLDFLVAHLDLREQALPLLGARGRWLAAQHPQWRALFVALAPESWETGSMAERVAYLRQVRAQDPDAARALLEATWKQESAAARAAFVAELRARVSSADEPFLEAALDDRSKHVRAAALEVLHYAPKSALTTRQYRRAAALLRVERGILGRVKLSVALPEACDAALERDGVAPKPPEGVGQRAWWLRQILAAVPPGVWTRDWQLEPAALIRLADATDYAEDLLTGWTLAAARCRDAAWAMALFERWAERRSWAIEDIEALCRAISPALLGPWLAAQLWKLVGFVQGGKTVSDDRGLLDVLRAYPYPWSEELTRAFLGVARELVTKEMKGAGPLWVWQAMLPELAWLADTRLLREAESGWPELSSYWRNPVERFLKLLHFRNEMQRAFVI